MLEQRDLEAIALLLDSKLEKSNEQMKGYIDERFSEYNKKVDERFSEYDKKLDGRFSEYDKKLDGRFSEYDKKLDQRFEKSEQSMKEFIRDQITNSESFLLEEMERMNNATNARIDLMQKNIDELTQYYRITKLENDNTTLLLRMVTRLQEDVEELKKKTA